MKKYMLMAFCLSTAVHADDVAKSAGKDAAKSVPSDAVKDGKSNIYTFNPYNEPVVSGKGLTAKQILTVISSHLGEYRRCYEKGLSRFPDMRGKVSNSFVIAADGSMESALADSADMSDRRFLGCLNAHAGRWTFPKSRDGGEVSFTYEADFHPSK